MEVSQAIILSLVYFFFRSAFNFSTALYLSRPLVFGLIVGIILNDLDTGIKMGIKLQLVFMGYTNTGGFPVTDAAISSLTGISFAILYKPNLGDSAIDAGITLAIALGALGNMMNTGRMGWNTIFAQKAKQSIREGNLKGLLKWNLVVPQVIMFIVTVVPLLAILLTLGDENTMGIINAIVSQFSRGLTLIGDVLPAIGLATTLLSLNKTNTIPFFIIGFFLAQYLNMNVLSIAISAAVVAYLMYFVDHKEVNG